MIKDKRIPIRVTSKEKEKLDKLTSITGSKNNSEFIRNYINDLYDFLFPISQGLCNLDEVIKKLQVDKENAKDPFSAYSIQNKITLLEEIKAKYLPKQP